MLLAIAVKVCTRCGVSRPAEQFPRNKNTRDGLLHQCKPCKRAAARAYEKTPAYRARVREGTRRWKDRQILAYLLTRARSRCRKSGVTFDISPDDLTLPAMCPLLGIPLRRGVGGPSPNSPSLDRFDSRFGYVRGNVWVVSARANMLKSDASLDELERLIAGLRAVHQEVAA